MTSFAARGMRRPPRTTVLAAALAGSAQVGLAAVALQGELAALARPPFAAFVVDVAAAAVALALLALAGRHPVRVGLATAALLTVSAATTPIAGTAALWVAQRRRLPVAIGVAAAGVAGHLVRGPWRPVPDRPFGLWILVIVASYAAIVGWGAMRQARGALVRSLEERARRAEDEQARRVAEARRGERTRIAREMHDVLAHRLSLLAAYAGAVEFRPDAPPADLARAAGVVRSGAHQALEELRAVIGVLRDDGADADGDHPQPTLTDLPRLVAESRDAGTPVRLVQEVPDPAAAPAAVGRAAYRVVQEALTNARRHAPGQPVEVRLTARGDELLVLVRNPLPAAPAASAASGTAPGAGGTAAGTGLVGLRERVELTGGRLAAGPAGGYFQLRATLPWSR